MGARAEPRAPEWSQRARGLHLDHATAAASSFADTLIRERQLRSRRAKRCTSPTPTRIAGSDKAADALRDAIETYMLADSAARRRGDTSASQRARDRAMALSERLATEYPRYQYRAQYQALRARLLAEAGKREEALTRLQTVIADNPSWTVERTPWCASRSRSTRSDARARGRRDYEAFAAAYPTDRRAADAQYNAAITYLEVPDSVGGRAGVRHRSRRVSRATLARRKREPLVSRMLRATGDSLGAERELASLCNASPTPDLRSACATAHRRAGVPCSAPRCSRRTRPCVS